MRYECKLCVEGYNDPVTPFLREQGICGYCVEKIADRILPSYIIGMAQRERWILIHIKKYGVPPLSEVCS